MENEKHPGNRLEKLDGVVREIHSGEHLTLSTVANSEIVIDNGAKLTVTDITTTKIIVRPKGALEVLGTWTDCDIVWE